MAADVGQHPPTPPALTPVGLFLTAVPPKGQAPAGSVITRHVERADMTHGMNQLRPDLQIRQNLQIRQKIPAHTVALEYKLFQNAGGQRTGSQIARPGVNCHWLI